MPTQNSFRFSASSRAFRFTPVAVAVLLASQPALTATRNWTGNAGALNPYWDLANNWNTGIPIGGDIAALGNNDTNIRNGTWALQSMSGTGTLSMTAGALSLNAASTMGDLIMTGGTLGSKGTFTTGTFIWNGGNLGSATALGGTMNVNGAATLNTASHYVNYGQALNLKNNSSWVDNGYLYMYGAGTYLGTAYDESTVNLSAGKTLTLQGNAVSYFQIAGPGSFNNAGTLTKNGSNGLYIDSIFNNTGTVNLNGGVTQFRNERSLGGTLNVAAGATAHFNGQTTLGPGFGFGGAGNLVFGGSYNLLLGGTETFGGAGTKTFEGGYLGGGGTMVFNKLAWNGGTMGFYNAVGGTTTVNGTTTISPGTKYVNYGRTLNLNGTTNFADNGTLYIYGAGTYNGVAYGASEVNLGAGEAMNLQGNAVSYFHINGPGIFNNAGTITKTGINTLYIESIFNNTGTLVANGGVVEFRGVRTLGGDIDVASGVTVIFNGTTTFAPSLSFANAGDLVFDGTASIVPGGTRTFGGAGTKTLTGGYLGGAGTAVFNKLDWVAGQMGFYNAVGGTTTVNGTTNISPGTKYVNYGRTLNFNGTTHWTDNGTLYIYGAGTYNGVAYGAGEVNLDAGKTMNLKGNAASYFWINGPGTFNNAGTMTKTGINTLYIESIFNNTGTLNLNGGVLEFRGIRTIGGELNAASGTTLTLNGTTTLAPSLDLALGGNLILDGTATIVPGGTRTFGGAGTKTFTGGYLGGAGTTVFNKLEWVGGQMGFYNAVGGTTTINGTTTISPGTKYVNYGRTVNFNGTTNWNDNGRLYIYGAGTYNGVPYGVSTVNVGAGEIFNLKGNAASYFQIDGPGAFNNAGTMTKTGPNIFYLDATTNNTGTLNANAGSVQIRGIFNNTGTLHANGARVDFTAVNLLPQYTAASQTLAAGTYRVTGNEPLALKLGNVSGTTPAIIKVNKAKIYLKNGGATILTTTPSTPINALSKLATNQGVLSLTTGATLTTTATLRNTVNGSLIVGSGSTLNIGGTGYTQVNAGNSTLVGGTLTAKTITFSAGSFSAGNASGLVGNGTMNAAVGGVNFSSASVFDQDLTAAGWDKLAVTAGNLIVDGTLDATFAAGVNVGTYRFLTTTTGNRFGTFDTVSSNLNVALYDVTAVYGAKFVDLKVTAVPAASPSGIPNMAQALPVATAVPEPETYALLLSGLALLGWQVRRRKAQAGC